MSKLATLLGSPHPKYGRPGVHESSSLQLNFQINKLSVPKCFAK